MECIFKGKSANIKSQPSAVESKEDLLNTIKVNVAALEASLSKIADSKVRGPPSQQIVNTTSLIKSKVESSSRVEINLVPNISSPSEDSETEQKYLELVDLLTVRMFEGSSNIEKQQEQKLIAGREASKKSQSLPRTLDVSMSRGVTTCHEVSRGLQKSSSQNFSEPPGPGLSAYERLFGRPRPGIIE